MHELARITLRLPKDVHEWLTKRADYNLGSMNSEIVRALREQMNAENRPAA
jgi:predicted HicB family RNase H-like nuclease